MVEANPKFPLPPCRVCYAPGTGFHYGVNTCEACKGFFHRSLVKWKTYKCANDRGCLIRHGKGLLCRFCRHQKCLEVGMSKTAVKVGRYPYKKKTNDILEVKQLMEHSKRMEELEMNGFNEEIFTASCQDDLVIEEVSGDLDDLTQPREPLSPDVFHMAGSATDDGCMRQSMDWTEEPFGFNPRENHDEAQNQMLTTNCNVKNDFRYHHNFSPSSPQYSTATECRTLSPTSSPMSPPLLSPCAGQWLINDMEKSPSNKSVVRLQLQAPPVSHYSHYVDEDHLSISTPTPSITSSGSLFTNDVSIIKTGSPSPQMPHLHYVPPTIVHSNNPYFESVTSCSPSKTLSPYCIPHIKTERPGDLADSYKNSEKTIPMPSLFKPMLHTNKDTPLHISNSNYVMEVKKEAIHTCQNELWDIEALFEDYESVIRSLKEANDAYVLQYFRRIYEEDSTMQQTRIDATTDLVNRDNDDHVGMGPRDFEETMEDTIRVMVSFAMAIPGFGDLEKESKVDLIRNSRHEFCLLNMFAYVNPKSSTFYRDSHCTLQYSTKANITKHTDCLNAIFSFMNKFQGLGLTHEECVILRALAIMTPDRAGQASSPTLPVIYDNLVSVFIYQLGKRLGRPLFLFAKLRGLMAECRTHEEKMTDTFRDLGPISFMSLKDKSFLKLIYSGIYS